MQLLCCSLCYSATVLSSYPFSLKVIVTTLDHVGIKYLAKYKLKNIQFPHLTLNQMEWQEHGQNCLVLPCHDRGNIRHKGLVL